MKDLSTILTCIIITLMPVPQVLAADVPIKGHFVGNVVATPLSITEPLFRLEIISSGVLSHLGKSKAKFVVPSVLFVPQSAQVALGNLQWTGTLTAANGDQISGTYTFRPASIKFGLTGDISYQADLKVTGGTGRFEGLSGQALATGKANYITQTFAADVNGRLSQ